MEGFKITIYPKINHFTYLIDVLIIFLNISNTYTIIPFLLFTRMLSVNSGIIFLINIVYLLLRFKGKINLPSINDKLLYIYVIICSLNFIFSFYTQTFILGFVPLVLVSISFYILLLNLFIDYKKKYDFFVSTNLIIKGYIWLCIYAISIVLFFLILIEVFNFNPQFNNVNSESFDIIKDNTTRTTSVYYFPYNLSLIITNSIHRLPFFHSKGTITSIFHEPHTMTFVVFPSFFLLFYLIKQRLKRIFLVIVFLIFLLAAASTMNIFAFLLTILIGLMIKYKKISLIIFSIFISVCLYLYTSSLPIVDLIKFKISSGSSSYSLSTLKFAFTPITLFGTNFFDISYAKHSGVISSENNVGFILFFLNIFFLILFIYQILYLLFSKTKYSFFVGLFASYFFIHSVKLTMTTYSLTFLIFVIFIVSTFYCEIKSTKSMVLHNIENSQ
ncbi:MAG: hypothetical protein AB7S48_10185 [Bacteroidales bacterium]